MRPQIWSSWRAKAKGISVGAVPVSAKNTGARPAIRATLSAISFGHPGSS
ncbi:hypothetical protein [Bradyrhizobium cosmicum]|nr:hypothetical protein [Bradyrhizobium cosmicum]